MVSQPVFPPIQPNLAHLERLPELDTRHPDYPLWLLAQTQDTLLALVRHSGVLLTEPLCADLASWVFGAAIVSKCVVDRIHVKQARLMVAALALTRLLSEGQPLHRREPERFEPTPAQLDILEEYARTGSWLQLPQPAGEVEVVRDALYALAVVKLSDGDALLVGLLRTLDDVNAARRALDVEEGLALRMLWGAWKRLQAEVTRAVEHCLRKGGRRPGGFHNAASS